MQHTTNRRPSTESQATERTQRHATASQSAQLRPTTNIRQPSQPAPTARMQNTVVQPVSKSTTSSQYRTNTPLTSSQPISSTTGSVPRSAAAANSTEAAHSGARAAIERLVNEGYSHQEAFEQLVTTLRRQDSRLTKDDAILEVRRRLGLSTPIIPR